MIALKLIEEACRTSLISSVSSAVLRSSSMMPFIFFCFYFLNDCQRKLKSIFTQSKVCIIFRSFSLTFSLYTQAAATFFKLYWIQQIFSMEQPLQTRLPIYALMGLTSILGTYLFMSWTADSGLAPLVKLFYNQDEIKTFAQELRIIVNTSYYFALIVIAFFSIAQIYKFIVQSWNKVDNPEEPLFTATTKSSLVVAFHAFIIFVSFFYYLLRNDGDDLNRRYINLLPFWFLASTILYLVGAWLSRWARLKLYWNGIIMILILWVLIIGEIYKNGFIQQTLNL